MAYVPNLIRYFYPYISDNGTTYQIATSADNGNAQSGIPQDEGTDPSMQRGWVPRHVFGEILDGSTLRRTKVPILDPTTGLWTGSTSSFNKSGLTGWTVTGRVGERRVTKGARAVT